MLSLIFSVTFFHLTSLCFAAPHRWSSPIFARDEATSSDLPCLKVISAAEQNVTVFWAADVADCLSRVPFHQDVALRFIDYYNQTIQYQSSLPYINQPPAGYQRPPFNVQQGLEDIKHNVTAGVYQSQYEFETQLQLLISRMYDAHVSLDAGILAAFKFASPYTLVSASPDGVQAPQIYLEDDVLAAPQQGWVPSPITQINDENVVDYLTSIAAINSVGHVEAHADWNDLMESPARDIQGSLSVLQSLTFYPGDGLNFTFANGSTLEYYWWAVYNEDISTGPLTTPGDFYNYFVLGLVPAGYNQENPTRWWPAEYDIAPSDEDNLPPPSLVQCPSGNSQIPNWCNATSGDVVAYPTNPVVAQADLTILGTGAVTGYIFDDISTAFLSIPTFFQDEYSVQDFFNAVDQFIGNSSDRNTKQVVIDLQQNPGGLVFLALTTFQQFFPDRTPYTGSRIRSHEAANILGTAFTQSWQSLGRDDASYDYRQYLAASEWVPLNRINAATGRNFSSWAEYFGPLLDRNDAFSQQQIYNLSNIEFDEAMFGWTYPAWTDPTYRAPAAKWAPENIVLLTDGTCSSACALFVEFMTAAGVRTISAGGRPETGPMQTASGSRGAAVYTADALDNDYQDLQLFAGDAQAAARLPSRNDPGMLTTYASFNIRDQMRPNDTIPLQFRYDASDCRIYYTLKNVYNMTQLWRDVATATWVDSRLCVADSTGYSQRTGVSPKNPPTPIFYPYTITNISTDEIELSSSTTFGLVDGDNPLVIKELTCPSDGGCGAGKTCEKIPTTCPGGQGQQGPLVRLCVPKCNSQSNLPNCKKTSTAQSTEWKAGRKQTNAGGVSLYNGYVQPASMDAARFNVTCPT